MVGIEGEVYPSGRERGDLAVELRRSGKDPDGTFMFLETVDCPLGLGVVDRIEPGDTGTAAEEATVGTCGLERADTGRIAVAADV